ncbi:MAG: ABC transporter permease [Acidobacteria bacterium]|nr:ABC transporter permease [Acidobacteriota bacterium]
MLRDLLAQTLRTLWGHKLRSVLTMLGIAWGVGSLLLLIGLGEGFRAGQIQQLRSIGEDIMFLYGGRIPAVEGSFSSARPFRLTYDDYLAIRTEAKLVREISPVLNRQDIRASSEFNSTNGQVFGVTPNYSRIRTLPLMTGRWMNDLDNIEKRRVAVIGHEMLKNMFPGRPAVGSSILLNGHRFEVVGVLAKIGREDRNATNIRVLVPINTMRMLFPLKGDNAEGAVSYVNYQPRTADDHESAKQEVHRIVGRRHGFDGLDEDSFDEWDTIQNAKTFGKIFDAMSIFLGGVGLVTLGLGAIGIINIMLVSVSERTKEIGLRKAIGATHRHILWQFFLEGALMTLLSGLLGVAGAAGLMRLLDRVQLPAGFDTPRIVPASAVLAVVSLSVAGIVAGLYPARKAALMTPVDALRME